MQRNHYYHMRKIFIESWLAETEGIFLNHEGTFGNQEGMITDWSFWLFAATIYWLQFNWMRPYNVV